MNSSLQEPNAFSLSGGLQLCYWTSGTGPMCIVPTPGWGVSAEYLRLTLQPLEDFFTVVYFETRGTGHSQGPVSPDEYGWDNFTSDLEALRQHLQVDRMWLFGHSEAGIHCVNYCLKYPEQVDGLLLVATYAEGDEFFFSDRNTRIEARGTQPWLKQAAQSFFSFPQKPEDVMTWLKTVLPLYFSHPDSLPQYSEVFDEVTCAFEPFCAQRPPFQISRDEQLSHLRIPTLIVVGADDFVCSPAQAQRLHWGIAGSKLLLIEQAGHFPWMEQPDAFYEGIRRFYRDWENQAPVSA